MEAEITPAEQIIENAKKTEEVTQVQGSMIPPAKEPKKGRGRPPGSGKKQDASNSHQKNEENVKDAPRPQFNIPTKVICYPLIKGVSAAGVSFVGDPRAAISADEAEGMAEALGMVLDKYMPDAMAKWGPELVLGMNLGQYGLRLYAMKKLKMEEVARKQPPVPENTSHDGANSVI